MLSYGRGTHKANPPGPRSQPPRASMRSRPKRESETSTSAPAATAWDRGVSMSGRSPASVRHAPLVAAARSPTEPFNGTRTPTSTVDRSRCRDLRKERSSASMETRTLGAVPEFGQAADVSSPHRGDQLSDMYPRVQRSRSVSWAAAPETKGSSKHEPTAGPIARAHHLPRPLIASDAYGPGGEAYYCLSNMKEEPPANVSTIDDPPRARKN